ncbi:unnamed protein product [Didymodactylos carnosus]|uniref:Uncharacterized protein n=1 Tax=Didymodactylos carnosus TaxID=1234261 RepID=A0A815E7J4_9BILA|nr:unnamed protein product [Didymodactylos carnosus]CAF1307677.1 unnamed protein product [Didymodactylos carnosus]CAF3550172.1 unnamed protein product [Didymodactylos carnosus]CAF4142259.1 unnamed protein product [Didymodactylos carnosus]
MRDFLDVAVPGYKGPLRHTVRRRLATLYHQEPDRLRDTLSTILDISKGNATTRIAYDDGDYETDENLADDGSDCSTEYDSDGDSSKNEDETSSKEEDLTEESQADDDEESSEIDDLERRKEFELLMKINSLLEDVRAMITFIRRSSIIHAHVRIQAKNQLHCEPKRIDQIANDSEASMLKMKSPELVLDFIVRWNSTYTMVKRFIGLKRVLEPFVYAIEMLSGRNCPTMALGRFVLNSLKHFLLTDLNTAELDAVIERCLCTKFTYYFETILPTKQQELALVASYFHSFTYKYLKDDEKREAKKLIFADLQPEKAVSETPQPSPPSVQSQATTKKKFANR